MKERFIPYSTVKMKREDAQILRDAVKANMPTASLRIRKRTDRHGTFWQLYIRHVRKEVA